MIPSVLLILPITALLIVAVACLVPVSVFWTVIDFIIKLRIAIKASADYIPENNLACKSFSYLPLVLPPHHEPH